VASAHFAAVDSVALELVRGVWSLGEAGCLSYRAGVVQVVVRSCLLSSGDRL